MPIDARARRPGNRRNRVILASLLVTLLLPSSALANAASAPARATRGAPVRLRDAEEREREVLRTEARGSDGEALKLAADHLAQCCAQVRAGSDERTAAMAEFAALLLRRIAEKSTRYADAAAALDGIARKGLPPLLASALDHARASMALHLGDRATADRITKELGYLTDWMVLGSLDNERGAGFAKVEDPEKGFDPQQRVAGKEREARWRRSPITNPPLGIVALDSLLRPNEQAAAYLRTTFRAREKGTIVLRLGSAEAVKLWLDGKPILAKNVRRPHRPEQDAVLATIEAGAHELLAKVCTQEKDWAFSCRVTLPDGTPVPELGCDATAQLPGPAPTPAPEPGMAPAVTALEYWSREAGIALPGAPAESAATGATDPKTRARAAYRMATLLRDRHAEDETDHADRAPAKLAVELDPNDSIARYLYALTLQQNTQVDAEKEANPSRREMEKAYEASPENVEVCIALAEHYTRVLPIPSTAKLWLGRALEVAPEQPRALLLRAEHLAGSQLENEAELVRRRVAASADGSSYAPALAALANAAFDRAQAAEAEKLARAAIAADRLGESGARTLLQILLSQGRVDEALALQSERAALLPFRTDPWIQSSQCLRTRGKLAEAIDAIARAIEICPEDAALHARLAHARIDAGDQEGAIRSLERCVELNPKDRVSARYLEWLRSSVKPFEESFRVDGAEIVKAGSPYMAAPSPADADEPLEAIYSQVAYKLNPDGTSQRYEHIVARVMNEEGSRRLDSYYFYHDPSEERVRIRRARVFRADGKVDDAPAPPGAGYVNFPPLAPGDVIDVEARIDAVRLGFFGNYFGVRLPFHALGAASTRFAEVLFVTPPNRKLQFHVRNGKPERSEQVDAEGGMTTQRFRMTALKRPKPESAMPDWIEFVPTVSASTYSTWNDFASWWWNLTKKECQSSPAIREKVAELTRGKETEAEKIRAVYDFVVTDIRYNAWEFGVHGYKPYNAATIFERRHGDCKDKAILIKTMLAEAGIESHPVIIYANDRRPIEDLTLPMVNLFNHCIAYVPEKGDRPAMFLDGTARNHPMAVLPDMDRGATVVVVEEGDAKIRTVPFPKAEENVDRLELSVELAADGSAKGTALFRPVGRYDVQFREFFGSEKGAQKENLERMLAQSLGKVTVTELTTSDLQDLAVPVELRAKIEIERLAKSKGTDLALPVHVSPKRLLGAASESARSYDLVLGVPESEDLTLRYKLPEGLSIGTIPADDQQSTEFGTYEIRAERRDREVIIRSKSSVAKHRITPAEYGPFRKFARDLDEAQAREITLKNDR